MRIFTFSPLLMKIGTRIFSPVSTTASFLTLVAVLPRTAGSASVTFRTTDAGTSIPIGVVPWWNVEFAVEEIARIKQLGLVGFNMVSDPQEYGLPDLSQPYWRPVFEAMEDADLPLNFHIGASPTQMSSSR